MTSGEAVRPQLPVRAGDLARARRGSLPAHRLPKGRHAVQFNLIYWQPVKYAIVVEDGDVILALADYLNSEPADEYAQRAAKALAALSKGNRPDEADIIGIALECYAHSAPEGTKPADYGIATDYQVSWGS